MEGLKQHLVGVIAVGATMAVFAAGLALLLAIPFAFPMTLSGLALAPAGMAVWAALRRSRRRAGGDDSAED